MSRWRAVDRKIGIFARTFVRPTLDHLIATLEQLLPAADHHDVTLGIEPESANVVDSARRARRLLDEMKSKQTGPQEKLNFATFADDLCHNLLPSETGTIWLT